MTDYSKMTKVELIEEINTLREMVNNGLVTACERDHQIAELDNLVLGLEMDKAELLTYRPGWWIGVVLLAMCLTPWVVIALMVR